MTVEAGVTPGERWTRDALLRLRDGRYRPAAWWRLLAASLERAAASRAARPQLPAQVDRWTAAWLAVAAASRLPPLPRLMPAVPANRELAWAAAVRTMLRWHLGMVEGPAGEPRARLSAADATSLARLWLAPRLVRAERDRRLFTGLVALAVATDVADGALARRRGPTRLGRDLDTLADACAGWAAALAGRRAGWIERPAALATGARYGTGLACSLWEYFGRCERPPRDGPVIARLLAASSVVAIAVPGDRRLATRAVSTLSLAALVASVAAATRARKGP